MRDEPKVQQRAHALVLAGLGGGVAALLWLAWVPSTRECRTVGECLSQVFSGMLLTVLAAALVLVALRLGHVRPVFLTTLLGFVGAGALVLSLEAVTSADGSQGLAPWWSWLLIGLAIAPLAHWVLQDDRRWWARVLPVLAVAGLVVGGLAWAQHERDQQRLDALTEVQVDPILRPELSGYHLLSSYGTSTPDGDVRYIRMSFSSQGTASGHPSGYQLPLQGGEPCQLVMALERSVKAGECISSGQDVTLEGEYVVGAGIVQDSTFLLLTGAAKDFTSEQFREAAQGARTSTLEELRDGVNP